MRDDVDGVAGDYPCPCCGHLVFAEPPGSFDICPVCFWEDDGVQLRWPDIGVGANQRSLIEAQRTFAAVGATEARFLRHVRPALDAEPLDDGWRPIDLGVDRFEPWGPDLGRPWPTDRTVLYWWRPTFWGPGPVADGDGRTA